MKILISIIVVWLTIVAVRAASAADIDCIEKLHRACENKKTSANPFRAYSNAIDAAAPGGGVCPDACVNANLTGNDLRRESLANADLSWTYLNNTDLRGLDLSTVKFPHYNY